MGKKTILKPIHLKFLEESNKVSYIVKNFYWTGGTVLSEFYLHHRESEDIDLFIENKEINLGVIKPFIADFARKNKIKKITHVNYLGLESFKMELEDGFLFKVDFNYYPFHRIEKGLKWKNIVVDSLLDIAVNKVHTISMKPRARDFVDLFFILQEKKYDINYLILQAKAKFDWDIDRIQLGHKLMMVKTFTDFPKMLVTFSQKKMEDFYFFLAKSFEKEIFR